VTTPGFTAEAAIFDVVYQYRGSAAHGSLAGNGSNVQPAQVEANSTCESGPAKCDCPGGGCTAGRNRCKCISCGLPPAFPD
jgi:hypothetical protein